MALLRSVLEHMSRVSEKEGVDRPEFVIFTGDIPSHQLSCQYHQARVIELVPGQFRSGLDTLLQ